jgi:hypothetical protein
VRSLKAVSIPAVIAVPCVSTPRLPCLAGCIEIIESCVPCMDHKIDENCTVFMKSDKIGLDQFCRFSKTGWFEFENLKF